MQLVDSEYEWKPGFFPAISVREPWASMIASGEKTIETRCWKTKFRGYLAIVASKFPKTETSGKVLAVVKISNCREMVKEDESRAKCPIYKGACVWELEDARKVLEPFEVKGKLGIYYIPWNKDLHQPKE